MQSRRSASPVRLRLSSFRSLATLVALAFLLVGPFVPSSSAWADEDPSQVAAAPSPYLDHLLAEINDRRIKVGNGPLSYATESANAAMARHTEDLTHSISETGACHHGVGSPARYSWDYVADTGFKGQGRGEVIGCPGPDGYWTPARIADGWWNSASHHKTLYADPTVTAVACGTFGSQRGGTAYQTIVCVTFRT